MNLQEMELDDFLCEGNNTVNGDVTSQLAEMLKYVQIGSVISNSTQGYAIHKLGSSETDVCLVFNGEPVGFYWGVTLFVDSVHQCKGLSIPLILQAVKSRCCPRKRDFSYRGKAALTKAWNVANGIVCNPWPDLSC